jgi:CheY-like chemotaxis protein
MVLMFSQAEFAEQVKDAYEHLYDLVYLRTHPLLVSVVSQSQLRPREKAWRLHNTLSNVIEELDPGPRAPVFSHEWRRYRLMVLRYLEGMDPQAVADELGISRRHYYREQESALSAIASVLWNRYRALSSRSQTETETPEESALPGHLELLRLEVARVTQASRYTSVGEVIEGVSSLLQDMLHKRSLELELVLPPRLPHVSMDQVLLRQLLLGMSGFLIERAEDAVFRVVAQHQGPGIHLTILIDPFSAVRRAPEAQIQDRLSAFEDIASLSGTQISPIKQEQSIVGFELMLPAGAQRTVLVVDDNEDVLQLFHRYLSPHNYRVITAQTARDALELAHKLKPYAITLDLMIPGQDGWDLLQILLNQPDTQHIPIIVCSVLKQKELALSLGATAFLEKPISEQLLLSLLTALEEA